MGRHWLALDLRDMNERWRGVMRAAPALEAFVAAELARRSLADRALALVGFSQGTMMALHVGLRRVQPPAAVIGYSGLLALPEQPEAVERAVAEIRGRPPVFLAHGARDDLIPAQALFVSANTLAAAGVPVEWHLSPDIGHGIDAEGLRQGGEFLAHAFARA
jgi:phospholipase/carboxylesterase